MLRKFICHVISFIGLLQALFVCSLGSGIRAYRLRIGFGVRDLGFIGSGVWIFLDSEWDLGCSDEDSRSSPESLEKRPSGFDCLELLAVVGCASIRLR